MTIRKLNLTVNHVKRDTGEPVCSQLDLFQDTAAIEKRLNREKSRQQAMLKIKRKYGKNAILKGTNYLEGATARERNGQIGGHKA